MVNGDWEDKGAFIIPATVFFALVLVTFAPSINLSSLKVTSWERFIDNLEKVVTILAVLIGGGWAYLKYIKGQLFRSHLIPGVEGKVLSNDVDTYLLVTAKLKNVSSSPVNLSKVGIQEVGTALQVFTCAPESVTSIEANINWTPLVTLRVFQRGAWLERGEEMKDQTLIALPSGDYLAFKFRLRIVSKGYQWDATTIVERGSLRSNESASSEPTQIA